tara:strand:+ start:4327 stop:4728 length:402 start_codon:yes stop_codon:yes gene_type:complete
MPTLRTGDIGHTLNGTDLFVTGTPAYEPNFGCPNVDAAAQFCTAYFESYFNNIKLFAVLVFMAIIIAIVFERKQAKNRRVLKENKEILAKIEESGQKGVKITPLLKEVVQKMDEHDQKSKKESPIPDKDQEEE